MGTTLVYTVQGAFFDKEKQELVEETTQVVRLLFRFADWQAGANDRTSPFTEEQQRRPDVVGAILRWAVDSPDELTDLQRWSRQEKERFLRNAGWLQKSDAYQFANKHFRDIVTDGLKWVDDCGLFVFGYLLKHFSQRVINEDKHEAEIWVASFFNLRVNSLTRVESA